MNESPDLFKRIEYRSNLQKKMLEHDEKINQELRNDSLQGMWQKTLARIQYSAAELTSMFVPAERKLAIVPLDNDTTTIKNMYEILKQVKNFNPSDMFVKNISFTQGSFLSGVFDKMFGSGRLKENQELISDTLGISTINLDKDTIAKIWAYRRSSLMAYGRYLSGLEQFLKNPEEDMKNKDGFFARYKQYFSDLAKGNFKEGTIKNGLDYTLKDNRAINIFERLVRGIVDLDRTIRELSNKSHLTKEEERRLAKAKEELQIKQNSLLHLYKIDNFGPAELFKSTGMKINFHNLEDFASSLRNIEKYKPQLWKELVKGYSHMMGVDTSTAEHALKTFSKDNWKLYREWSAKTGLVSSEYITPVALHGGMGEFVTHGGGKLVSDVFSKVKNVNDIIKVLDAFKEAQKELPGIVSTHNSDAILTALLASSKTNLSSDKIKAIAQFNEELKKHWNDFTGGEVIKVGKYTFRSYEDFLNADDKGKRAFFSAVASSQLVVSAATRLGVGADVLGSEKGQEALKILFGGGKYKGIVKYEDGKFRLADSVEHIKELAKNNAKFREALQTLNITPNKFGLKELIDNLNNDNSAKLDKTNSLLNKIYVTLKNIEHNKTLKL